jgi:hypothetical protein
VLGETVDAAAEVDEIVEEACEADGEEEAIEASVDEDAADDEAAMVDEVEDDAADDEIGVIDVADDNEDEAAEVAAISLRPPMMFPF